MSVHKYIYISQNILFLITVNGQCCYNNINIDYRVRLIIIKYVPPTCDD